jgi:hypothetical protein
LTLDRSATSAALHSKIIPANNSKGSGAKGIAETATPITNAKALTMQVARVYTACGCSPL